MTVLLLSALLLPVVYGFSLFGGAEVSSDGPSIVTPDGTMHLEDMEAIVNPDYHLREKREYGYYKNWGSFPNLLVSSEPPSNWHQRWLTYEHNRYRRMVPASDMRLLYWSDELARSAQRHADRCDFRHSRDRVNVGENIWAAPYSNYSEAISIWFAEVHNPWCGCQHAYKHCCGHYVQVVWAKTSLVGCGFARCQDVWGVQGRGHRNVFVCHYNPQGNTGFQVPAFTWATGEKGRCSDCPKEAPACFQGLCYMPANSTETTQSARSTASTMAPTTTATTPATTTRNRWADEKRTTTNPRWIFNEQLRRWEKNTSFNNDEPSSNRWQNTNNVNDFRRWRH